MGKRRRPTPARLSCVYCGRDVLQTAITRDHVIARAWYPDGTLHNLPKWKVPACRACNNDYSKLEQDSLVRLAHCLDPNHPASQGIYERARRAIDPTTATTEKERRFREKARQRFLQSVRELDEVPPDGALPSFIDNFHKGSRIGILIGEKELQRLAEKWTRGLHYESFGTVIRPPNEIDLMVAVADDSALQEIMSAGIMLLHPPGVAICRLSATEDNERHTVYKFTIWEQFVVHSAVDETL